MKHCDKKNVDECHDNDLIFSTEVSSGESFSVTHAEFDVGSLRLVVKEGDITEEDTDAIVNITNNNLDLSKGVFYDTDYSTHTHKKKKKKRKGICFFARINWSFIEVRPSNSLYF